MLNKKDFKHIFLMEFRDIGMELANFAYSRKLRTRKSYKEALEFLLQGGAKSKIDVNFHRISSEYNTQFQ